MRDLSKTLLATLLVACQGGTPAQSNNTSTANAAAAVVDTVAANNPLLLALPDGCSSPSVLAAAFTADSKSLVYVVADATCGANILVWDVPAQQVKQTVSLENLAADAAVFSADASELALYSDGYCYFFDTATGTYQSLIGGLDPTEDNPSAFPAVHQFGVFSSDNATFYYVNGLNTVHYTDVATGKDLGNMFAEVSSVSALTLSPDNSALVVVSTDANDPSSVTETTSALSTTDGTVIATHTWFFFSPYNGSDHLVTLGFSQNGDQLFKGMFQPGAPVESFSDSFAFPSDLAAGIPHSSYGITGLTSASYNVAGFAPLSPERMLLDRGDDIEVMDASSGSVLSAFNDAYMPANGGFTNTPFIVVSGNGKYLAAGLQTALGGNTQLSLSKLSH